MSRVSNAVYASLGEVLALTFAIESEAKAHEAREWLAVLADDLLEFDNSRAAVRRNVGPKGAATRLKASTAKLVAAVDKLADKATGGSVVR